MLEWVGAPWGRHAVVHSDGGVTVKLLEVAAGGALSVQRHRLRGERWTVVYGLCRAACWEGGLDVDREQVILGAGDRFEVPVGWTHSLEAFQDTLVLEVIEGVYDPDDIERLSDRYGR
jgi:mannose-1-phosphate guanylyltransferase/mannose-6-phosphate isomerase